MLKIFDQKPRKQDTVKFDPRTLHTHFYVFDVSKFCLEKQLLYCYAAKPYNNYFFLNQ